MTYLFIYFYYIITTILSQEPTIYAYLTSDTTSCKFGNMRLDIPGYDIEVTANFDQLYVPEGLIVGGFSTLDYSWRATVCGGITTSTACEGSGWSLEQINRTLTSECLQGIANWNTVGYNDIVYFVTFNDQNQLKQNGLYIETTNNPAPNGLICPNNITRTNFDIICDNNQTQTIFRSISANIQNCSFNATLASPYACLDWKLITNNNDNNNNKISVGVGDIILIIFIVLIVMYCVLGMAINSFCHGRMGADAIPNRKFWANLVKFTKAGCQVTRDVCCCSTTSNYVEL